MSSDMRKMYLILNAYVERIAVVVEDGRVMLNIIDNTTNAIWDDDGSDDDTFIV